MTVPRPMTSLITVQGNTPERHRQYREDPRFLYVGRANPRTGYQKSPLANPYRGPDAVWKFAEYADYMMRGEYLTDGMRVRAFVFRQAVASARGKILLCWCGDYSVGGPVGVRCHGVVLCHIAEGLPAPGVLTDSGGRPAPVRPLA